MRFSLEIGNNEKQRIDFYRGPVFGAVIVTANGVLVAFTDPEKLSTHLDPACVTRYQFVVGNWERHDVIIEKARPQLLGGMRRNTYRVLVDGELVERHYGY